MAVVLLVLVVVASATAGPAGRNRFVPNEIIVKFRSQPTDANDAICELRPEQIVNSAVAGTCKTLQRHFRVREIRPLVRA